MRNDGDMRTIDARGHRCPTPTLKLRRAVAEGRPRDRLKLICDDPMARIDVPHFAAAAGLDLIEAAEHDGVLSFVVAIR
jgi:tRNA 2-thiouridine synthesizing protein A